MDGNNHAVICAEGLAKVFRLSRGRKVEAVKGVTLSVSRGEIYGLLGPNGAGKTTLLRMLGTIITPTAGHSTIAGIDAQAFPQEARRRIGFLSGNTRLYARLTPSEVLLYFGRLYGLADASIADRTRELSEVLGMADILHRRCDALSTGQLQKASIARVLLHDPDVLILDEPTLGLDIMTSSAILDFISHSKERGKSVIFSTHYMTEAEYLCDRIGLIYQGSLLAEGTQDELNHAAESTNLKDSFLALVRQHDVSSDGAEGTVR